MMTANQTELSYRRSAIEGASAIGLVIALYDTLAGDLRRAASALRNNQIEKRCTELNHASLVLGQLESWVDLVNGGELARNLASLYSYLRSKMIEAAATKSAALLDEQIDLILQVRGAWQQRDVAPSPTMESPVLLKTGSTAPTPTTERIAFTLSA